jgi:hypothetical protein
LQPARQTWKVDDVDGRSARVRVNAHPSRPLQATKALVLDEGRATVIVGFGDDVEDAHYLSLTIPDAHELVRMVQHALDAPVPALAPG